MTFTSPAPAASANHDHGVRVADSFRFRIPQLIIHPPTEEPHPEPCVSYAPNVSLQPLANPDRSSQTSLFNALLQLVAALPEITEELPYAADSDEVANFVLQVKRLLCDGDDLSDVASLRADETPFTTTVPSSLYGSTTSLFPSSAAINDNSSRNFTASLSDVLGPQATAATAAAAAATAAASAAADAAFASLESSSSSSSSQELLHIDVAWWRALCADLTIEERTQAIIPTSAPAGFLASSPPGSNNNYHNNSKQRSPSPPYHPPRQTVPTSSGSYLSRFESSCALPGELQYGTETALRALIKYVLLKTRFGSRFEMLFYPNPLDSATTHTRYPTTTTTSNGKSSPKSSSSVVSSVSDVGTTNSRRKASITDSNNTAAAMTSTHGNPDHQSTASWSFVHQVEPIPEEAVSEQFQQQCDAKRDSEVDEQQHTIVVDEQTAMSDSSSSHHQQGVSPKQEEQEHIISPEIDLQSHWTQPKQTAADRALPKAYHSEHDTDKPVTTDDADGDHCVCTGATPSAWLFGKVYCTVCYQVRASGSGSEEEELRSTPCHPRKLGLKQQGSSGTSCNRDSIADSGCEVNSSSSSRDSSASLVGVLSRASANVANVNGKRQTVNTIITSSTQTMSTPDVNKSEANKNNKEQVHNDEDNDECYNRRNDDGVDSAEPSTESDESDKPQQHKVSTSFGTKTRQIKQQPGRTGKMKASNMEKQVAKLSTPPEEVDNNVIDVQKNKQETDVTEPQTADSITGGKCVKFNLVCSGDEEEEEDSFDNFGDDDYLEEDDDSSLASGTGILMNGTTCRTTTLSSKVTLDSSIAIPNIVSSNTPSTLAEDDDLDGKDGHDSNKRLDYQQSQDTNGEKQFTSESRQLSSSMLLSPTLPTPVSGRSISPPSNTIPYLELDVSTFNDNMTLNLIGLLNKKLGHEMGTFFAGGLNQALGIGASSSNGDLPLMARQAEGGSRHTSLDKNMMPVIAVEPIRFSELPTYCTFFFKREGCAATLEMPVDLDLGHYLDWEMANRKQMENDAGGGSRAIKTLYWLHGFTTFANGRFITYTRVRNGSKWFRCVDEDVNSLELGSRVESKGVICAIYRLVTKY